MRNPITGDILPENWELTIVDDIKSNDRYACVAGPFGSDISSKYFVEEGTPVIRGNNLTTSGDKFISEGFVFVSPARARSYIGQHVRHNDLVFTCWGTLGQVGIIPKEGPFKEYIISNKQLKLRVDEEKVNPVFLYYYFSTKTMVQYINNIAIGAAVPGINLGLLKNLPVVLPPKRIQDEIASVLDYYYNLIENNNERISLLEEMAEEIYKEWFVRLRFPGYKDSKFHDKEGAEVPHGTQGAIPSGWEPSRISNVVREIGRGPSLNYDITNDEGKPVLNQSCVRNGVIELQKVLYAEDIPTNKKQCYLKENDILINSMGDGTLGRVSRNVQIEDDKYIIHNCITYLRAKEDYSQYLLYYVSKQNQPYYIAIAQGSTGQSTLKKELVEKIKILKPNKELLNSFDSLIEPIWKEIGLLLNKNDILKETRDLLLPRLMSGKLNVEELELDI